MARTVTVSRERLRGWLERFGARHGSLTELPTPEHVALQAPDGAEARLEVPFPPLPEPSLARLLDHVARDRRVAVLLVRKGGHAAGIFDGARLHDSKVGSGYVQGRTKAGGWSQQRYQRRRTNQANKAYADAATDAARVFLPELETLEHLVTGGDKAAVEAVLADPRLEPLSSLRERADEHVYPVPDPRLRVLQEFHEQFLGVRIGLNELA